MSSSADSLAQERLDLAARGYADPVFFCRWFLSELFPKPMPWVHRGLLAILRGKCDFLDAYGEVDLIIKNFVYERDGQKVAIFSRDEQGRLNMTINRYTLLKLPRGFAKTTLAGIAVPIMEAVYQDRDFFVYTSESGTHAAMQLNNVKRQLEDNPRIKTVFGELKPDLRDAQKWTETEIETKTGVTVVCRGRGGQIRGLNKNGQRPKKIIVDDVEDKESVKTEEQRKKTREWMYGDVMPALPELDPTATITVLGTLLHTDALLQTLSRDPQWTVVAFGALDVDGNPLWKENLDLSKLELKRRSFAAAGELSTYWMEYFNILRHEDSSKFKNEYIKRIMPYEVPPLNQLTVAVYCDPAISESRRADDCVILAVGMTERGRIIALEGWGGQGKTPREVVDQFFVMHKRWKARKAGVESNAYQRALIHLLREEMFRHKHYFEVQPINNTERKIERIDGVLQPRYAAKYVEHACDLPKLEAQLLEFPHNKKWDWADAMAGAVALLDPFAAHAAGDDDLAEDEFDEQEEPVLNEAAYAYEGGAP